MTEPMTPTEALKVALHQQSDTAAALAEGTEYWFPVSLAELASGTIAALPPGSALVTTETLYEVVREAATKPHYCREGEYGVLRDRCEVCWDTAAAIIEALRHDD